MSFENLGLAPELLENIKNEGYKNPSLIQSQAIPKIIKGKDVIAGAQTGTGKTAAFALPVLHKLLKNYYPESSGNLKALILTPTRELAQQTFDCIKRYSKGTPLRTVVLYGGVSYSEQIKRIEAGADIVVGTPGRLMDHLERGNINFKGVKYFVVDEADRMLDMGFSPIVKSLASNLPRSRQSAMFSATFIPQVVTLGKMLLRAPEMIQAERSNSAASKAVQEVYPVDENRKRELLSYMIGVNRWDQVMIFTRTKKSADELAAELAADGIKNRIIHGEKTQADRNKSLRLFKQGKVQALVATDIASRGIDIDDLPVVVNYELPVIPEDYVHRVGRTARAGKAGLAVTLITEKEAFRLDAVERFIKANLTVKKLPGFEPRYFDLKAIALDIKRRIKAKKTYKKLKQQELDRKKGKKVGSSVKGEMTRKPTRSGYGKKSEGESTGRRGRGKAGEGFTKSSGRKKSAPTRKSSSGSGPRSSSATATSRNKKFGNSKFKSKPKPGRRKFG